MEREVVGSRGPKPTVNPEIVVERAIQTARTGGQIKDLGPQLGISRQRIYQILHQEKAWGSYEEAKNGPPSKQ